MRKGFDGLPLLVQDSQRNFPFNYLDIQYGMIPPAPRFAEPIPDG
jgi:hypothetical protein